MSLDASKAQRKGLQAKWDVLLDMHGKEALDEAFKGREIHVRPGASVTVFDIRMRLDVSTPRAGVRERFTKGIAPHGQALVVEGIRSGSRHKIILCCKLAPGAFNMITTSGGSSIPADDLGIEITIYDMPEIVEEDRAHLDAVEKQVRATNADDPRFAEKKQVEEEPVDLEALAKEGFGSW